MIAKMKENPRIYGTGRFSKRRFNIGAAGTFVFQKPISQAKLRLEFQRHLPFETEAMICAGNDIVRLASAETFAGAPCGPDIVRFVSILAKPSRVSPVLPLR